MWCRNAFLGACLLMICCVVPMSGQQPAASASNRSNEAVPPLVNFSSVLTDGNGIARNGITGVTFLLYKEEQGGAPLWMETQNVHTDKTGHYTVMLGSTTSTGLPGDIFVAGEARWLAVQPQGQAEQPRILLLSVPYALKAGDAQTIGGLPPSAFVLAAPPSASSTSGGSPSAAVQPLATGTTPVTTAGGTVNKLAKFDATADITSSQIFDNGTNVGIGNTSPAAKLDVSGSETVRGLLSLPATGTATATGGKNSQPIRLTASVFNSGTAAAVAQNFQWQAEPVGNNTATTSGTLNLLYAAGTAALAETGLKIANNGRITFAAGQTFPGTGSGTITGVTAGTGLTGGGTSGTVTLKLDTTKVPQLAAANTFTGNQTVNGNVSATGLVTGTAFNIGSNPFAFGSYSAGNALLGFAGNSTMTGTYNLGAGFQALSANTAGNYNMAVGNYALHANTTGVGNTASGSDALYSNTTGNSNTASGYQALGANTTGFYNTAIGASALYSSTGGENTASGFQALYANTTGSNNTASGFNSLYLNTTGLGNTAAGYGALTNNTTGNNNTALGSGAGPDHNSPNLTNATAIGYNAVVSESNALVLGGTGANAVTVGIGTATPAYTLDVHGSGRFTQPILFAPNQTFPGTGTGTVTSVSAATGSGLTVATPTTTPQIGTDFTVIQKRVATSCPSGQFLQGMGADGTPTCAAPILALPSGLSVLGSSPTPPAGFTETGWVALNGTAPWKVAASLNTARAGAAVASIGSKIFAAGGCASTELNSLEQYDASVPTPSWITVTPTSGTFTARCSAAAATSTAAVSTGAMYVFGGDLGSVTPPFSTAVDMWNPAANTWTSKASLPQALFGACATTDAAGYIYILGGFGATSELNTVYKYDPARNVYSILAPMPTAAEYAACALYNNKIYVFGGRSGWDVNLTQIYDVAGNSWTSGATIPMAIEGQAAAVLGSQIYVMGGDNFLLGAYSTLYVYDPTANTWASGPPSPIVHDFTGAAVVNNLLYEVAGNSTGGVSAETDVYNPAVVEFIYTKN